VVGIWQDNTETTAQDLANYRTQQKEERVRFGFPVIDAHWVAHWGKSVFIAGSSGDGKTTLVNSLVYNMARAGERILYVTTEFEPKEIWEFLAFIHTHQFHDRTFLPSQAVWKQGAATDEDEQNMLLVLDDIKQRTTVPGSIDVQKFFTWDEIEQYWEAHNTENQYTVIAVDYIYKLSVPTGKFVIESQAKNAMISRAITWCHQKASFVLISPHQVNRESHKAAIKDGGGYNLDSLYASSAIQQDADLVMGLLSSKENRGGNEVTVMCMKSRGTEDFPDHQLKMDPRTKYVQDADEYKAEQKVRNEKAVAEIRERMQAAELAKGGKIVEGGAIEAELKLPDRKM
jgi:hypothetical protein